MRGKGNRLSSKDMKHDPCRTFWIINQYASTPDMGIGGRHYYLAREMALRGHNVYVIAAGYTHLLRKPAAMKQAFTTQTIDGINYVWVRALAYKHAHDKRRIFNWFWFSFQLHRLRKYISTQPDAILVSSPSLLAFLGAEWLAREIKARLVFEVRDIWPLTLVDLGGYSARHPFIRFLQWIEDRAYRVSDHVVSNLPNALEHMQTHGLTPTNFTWIGNGFSMQELGKPQPLAVGMLDVLPKGAFRVGYAGTLGLANALDTLLNAAGILQAQGANVVFVLLGHGNEKTHLQQRVKSENLSNVLFLDPIPKDQVQSFLKVMDACYMGAADSPLYKYGVSPNKLFDYFYSAKPIVYAISSGNYCPVTEAGAGISVRAEDAPAIAAAITQLQKMSLREREAMGTRGRSYVTANHEYGMLADKLIEVLID